MSDLRKELEAAGLAEYAELLEKQRVDLQVLAGLTDADLGQLCCGWPFGDQVRLRRLCEKLRAQSAATSMRESATSARPPGSSGSAPGAGVARVPQPSIEFDRDLIDNLPMVIARPLGALLDASEAMIVVRRADLLLENTIRFLGLVCQADYYSHPNWFDGAINVAIDKKLRRPTLGHWIEFVRECLQSASRAGLEPFLLQLPESWRRLAYERRHTQSSQIYDDVGELVRRDGELTTLDWLSSTRNAYAHAKRSPEDPQAAADYRDMACKFVDELRWIRQYELWAVDRRASLRLRGLQPIAERGGPRGAVTAGWSIALRRRSIEAPGGSRTLELPPLIVAELNLRKDASVGEPALYSGEGPNNTLSYTPTALNAVAIETPRTAEEYRRARGKKQFRKISRDQLTAEELRLRIDTATNRSIEILKETAKYRPHLHFVRSRCEPQIEAWIRSSKPLLGIEARAGAGKTGILASLVHKSWAALSERPPILFLLARDFESSSLERVLRGALVLDEDVSLDLVSDCLGVPPVFVIDGLNEHKLREDLLEGIVREAERTMRSGKGPRFAISWRSEDRAWVSPKLRQRDLWWDGYSARHSIPQSSKDFNRSGGSVERSGLEPKPGDGGDAKSSPRQDSSLEPKSNLIGASPNLREPDPCFIVPRLSDDELAQMWQLYRDGDRDKCRPRFSFEQLRSKSSAFANDLRNPLDMRIALEMYNDREIGEVRQGSLYAEYLGTLRDRSSDCDQLLKLLSELLAEELEASVHEYAITQRRASLVYTNGPISALDFLERVGVVTIWTEGEPEACPLHE